MTQEEIISMAEQAGWLVIGENIYSPSSVGEDEDLIEEINALVKLAAENERSRISEAFWASVNSCVTTDELGVEFMQKFYAVHIFGHWLDSKEQSCTN